MKGIVFDFNGTLYWDSQLHYDVWRIFSKRLRGYEFSDDEMRTKMFGHTNEDIIEYAINKKPTSTMVAEYSQEKEELYRKQCLEDTSRFKLAPGAVELLDYLKENNIPRNIATMSDWSNVEFYIKEFYLDKWFDVEKIVYSDGTFPGKPAPDIFEIAAARINIQPKDCVAVEDAIAGIKSASSAGYGKVIAIASMEPVDYYKNIKEVDCIIRNFNEFDRSMFN